MKNLKLIHLFITVLVLSMTFISCDRANPETTDGESSTGDSGAVTIENAKADLLRLLGDLDGYGTKSTHFSDKKISNSYTYTRSGTATKSDDTDLGAEGSGSDPSLYVFEFGAESGYAIYAGDSEQVTLIGIADKGDADSTLVDHVYVAISKDYQYTTIGGGSGTYTEWGDWKNIIYKDGGYCPVKWDQGKPYNTYCFTSSGAQSLTGCVATATAQLMAVYQYPPSHNGYTYDWDAMTEKPRADDISSFAAKMEIARLMSELGRKKNLKVEYKTESASASSKHIPRTLENFGYSSGGKYTDYDLDKIVSELRGGYSVLISGGRKETETKSTGSSDKVRHCWLCHGLMERKRTGKTYSYLTGEQIRTEKQSQWYLLCNWGWNGSHDGYFLTECFDAYNDIAYDDNGNETSESGTGSSDFKYGLKVITGIRK